MIAAPPFETGTVHETTDRRSAPLDADTPAGAPGTVEGIAGAEADEASLGPDAFVAVTVNV